MTVTRSVTSSVTGGATAAGTSKFGYDFGGNIEYFVDPDAAAGGNGTEAAPYDDFTEINTLFASGPQTNVTIKLKAGTTLTGNTAAGSLAIIGDSWGDRHQNITLESYGSGANPIIDRGAAFTPAWTRVGATEEWISDTNPNGNGNWTGVMLDDYWFPEKPSQADLQDINIRGTTTRLACASWLDTGPATDELHIWIPTGVWDSDNPNNATTARYSGGWSVPAEDKPFAWANIDGFTVKNIDWQLSRNGPVGSGDWKNVTIENCNGRWSAADDGTTSTGFIITGQPTTLTWNGPFTMNNCEIYETRTHAMAASYVQNARFTDCYFHDLGSNLIEMANSCDTWTFERCKVYRSSASDAANIVNMKAKASDDSYTDILMRNCVVFAPKQEHQVNNSPNRGSKMFNCETGVTDCSWTAVNCTFYTEDQNMAWVNDSNVNYSQRSINCIWWHSQPLSSNLGIYRMGTGISAAVCMGTGSDVTDWNFYFRPELPNARWFTEQNTQRNWSQWQGLTESPDPNSDNGSTGVNQLDVASTSFAAPDFTPDNGSPVRILGDTSNSLVPDVDIDGTTRTPTGGGKITAGAYENQTA